MHNFGIVKNNGCDFLAEKVEEVCSNILNVYVIIGREEVHSFSHRSGSSLKWRIFTLLLCFGKEENNACNRVF